MYLLGLQLMIFCYYESANFTNYLLYGLLNVRLQWKMYFQIAQSKIFK